MNFEKLKINEDVNVINFDFELPFNKTTELNKTTIFLCIKKSDINLINETLNKYDETIDSKIFIMFPKKSSKKYKNISDVSRDIIRESLEVKKFNLVSLVSIDNDFSCARVRFNKFIKGYNG